MHEQERIANAVQRTIERGKRGLLVTVVATRGSTYRRAGACVVISEDGEITGAISGGCVERDLAERARTWLDGAPRTITYDSSRADDIVFGLGLGCRGEMDLRIEPFGLSNPPQLRAPGHVTNIIVFGNGADTKPVAELARTLGWRVTVTRNAEIDLTGYDGAVVMTHNFLFDEAILARLLATPIAYIGLLGPRRRGDELFAAIGAGDAARSRVHNPIGLDLGAETPEEIGSSIVAEVQAALRGRSAKPLSQSTGPIHAMPVTAIILAAGASTRFGAPKQHHVFRGETLLARAVRTAREAGCARVIAVVRPGDSVEGAEIVENADAAQGISTSIRAGARAAAGARVLILLCDQPFITPAHLRALINADAPIAATAYDGITGVPAVFDARYASELMSLTGDRGARSVIEAHTNEVVALPFEDAAIDIDTPDDACQYSISR